MLKNVGSVLQSERAAKRKENSFFFSYDILFLITILLTPMCRSQSFTIHFLTFRLTLLIVFLLVFETSVTTTVTCYRRSVSIMGRSCDRLVPSFLCKYRALQVTIELRFSNWTPRANYYHRQQSFSWLFSPREDRTTQLFSLSRTQTFHGQAVTVIR